MSMLRRRNVFVALSLVACLYFFISVFSSYMTVKELSQPPYTLISLLEPVEHLAPNIDKNTNPRIDVGFGIIQDVNNIKFIPSFFSTSTMLLDLLKNDEYASRVLSNSAGNKEIWMNQSVFSCICGRVSDTCVCCGPLGIPSVDVQSNRKSLILFSDGDSDSATFCVNITYLPKKQEAKMTGFLIPTSKYSAIIQRNDKNNEIVLSLNSSRMLVLFDSQLVPLNSPPALCAENSKDEPVLMLCSRLSSLHYGIESSVDQQTVFTGCLDVSVLVKRRWTITRYPQTCFRAHRGAAGDVDQAAAARINRQSPLSNSSVLSESHQELGVSKHPVPVDNPNHETSKSETKILVPIQPELKVKVPIPINAAHQGVP